MLANTLQKISATIAGGAMFKLLEDQVKGVAGAMIRTQQTMSRLRFSNDGDAGKVAEDYAFINQTADRLGLSLKDAADGYTKFGAAAKASGLETEKIRQTYLGVAEASKVLGLTSSETSLTFQALTQMASKQKITMEELRQQMSEKLVVAMSSAAEATGLSTEAFNEQMAQGSLDINKFFPAFAYQLRNLAEKELPNATKSLDSEVNRFLNQIERMRSEAGQGEMGKQMAEGIRSLTKALSDPAIAEGFQAISGGFAMLLKAAGDSGPSIGSIFVNVADTIGTTFAAMFVQVSNGFQRIMLKQRALAQEAKAWAAERAGDSVFTSWAVGGKAGGAAVAKTARGEAAAASAELAGMPSKAEVDQRTDSMKADLKARIAARAAAAKAPPKAVVSLTPPVGVKPPNAPFDPKKGDGEGKKANAMAAALKSFETAVAEAQIKVNAAIRDRKLAQLDQDLAKEKTTQEKYLKDRAALEKEALDEEIKTLRTLQSERQAALAKAQASGKAPEVLKVKAELKKIDAELSALAEKKVIVDIKLGTDSYKLAQEAERYLKELDAAFKDMSGDKFGAVADRINKRLSVDLADPKKQDSASQDKLKRNAELEQKRNELDKATAAFERKQRELDLATKRNNDQVSRGEMSPLAAEQNIQQARLAVRDAMKEQYDIAVKLGDAIKDPDVLLAIQEMGLKFKESTTIVDEFGIAIKEGVISDLKQGFSDLIQKGEKLTDILKKIAANALQKYADKYFDVGIDALTGKKGKTGDTGAGAGIGKAAGDSFLGAVEGGWSAIQNLFSGLSFDSLFSGLSSMLSSIGSIFSGGGAGAGGSTGGFISSVVSAFTGRATGGAVFANKPYMVGERGIEPFFPGQPGNIVPTARVQSVLAEMMGMNAQRMPSFNLAGGLAGSMPQPSGSTNVHVTPKVQIAPREILDGLMQDPGLRQYIVKTSIEDKNRINRG